MSTERGFAGTVLVVLAALLIAVLGGLSLELWRVVHEHGRLSSLAEGAALSGATAIDVDLLYAGTEEPLLDPREATARACAYLEHHGEIPCGRYAEVTIVGGGIDVIVRSDLDLTLLRLVEPIGSAPITVAGHASATVLRSG